MEHPDGERGVLAVLDELAEVREPVLLGLGVLLDERDDRLGDGGLVLEAALVAEHAGEEVHQDAVLAGELEAEALDRLHHHDLGRRQKGR